MLIANVPNYVDITHLEAVVINSVLLRSIQVICDDFNISTLYFLILNGLHLKQS